MRRSPPRIVAEIVERTDGVPLFVEELTKAVLESAAQSDQVAAVLGSASLRLFKKLQRGDLCTH